MAITKHKKHLKNDRNSEIIRKVSAYRTISSILIIVIYIFSLERITHISVESILLSEIALFITFLVFLAIIFLNNILSKYEKKKIE